MKNWTFWLIFLLAALFVAGLVVPTRKTILAVILVDVELDFVAVDSVTKEPIPGAKISLHVEETLSRPADDVTLTTDDNGCAMFLRKGCMGEDHIANDKLIGTSLDLNWCGTRTVTAKGYKTLDGWLLETPREQMPYSSETHRFNVVFRFPLQKETRQEITPRAP
jgi:hypothetical protein